MSNDLRTKEYVNECFTYLDGKLFWKHRPISHFTSEANQKRFNSKYAGREAGYINYRTDSKVEGFAYHRVRLWGKLQKTHRIIFLMHYGYLPETLDHIDGNSLNNRIENLREITIQNNAMNSNTNYNKDVKGVYVSSGKRTYKYRAIIYFEDKPQYVGAFLTESEAQAAYNLAGLFLYGKEYFRPVCTDFSGNVRSTSFFKVNKLSTEYMPA